jgi:alkyl hydroperoxide reductase subunit AhpC
MIDALICMKNRILFALIALLFAACAGPVDHYEVSGKVEGHAQAWVYLDLVQPKANQPMDSVLTDAEGNFALKTAMPQPGIYNLRLPNHQSLLFFANENPVEVTATQGQFSAGVATGNTETAVLTQFNKERSAVRNEFITRKRMLQGISRDLEPERWSAQEMKADQSSEAYRNYVIQFADTVKSPLLAEFAIYNLNPEGDFYRIQQFVDAQKAKKVTSPFVNDMEANILSHGKNFLRFEATDFKLPTISGDSVSLKSLRGKVVYLYVWASYCGLSRMENARLAKWYDAHPNSQVEILSFSIDKDSTEWRRVIAEDKMNWPVQMRGISNWGSAEIKQFDVRTIPTTFVLDAKGIIRTKSMHASELARDYDKIVEMWGAK